MFLFVAGRQAQGFGADPDLQQVHFGIRGRIELAVGHTGPGAHALQVIGANDRTVAHGVAMLQLTGENVGENFHVAVAVLAEALARGDAVVVDDAQRAVFDPLRILVIGERERVVGLQPAVVEKPALVAAAHLKHGGRHPRCARGSTARCTAPW